MSIAADKANRSTDQDHYFRLVQTFPLRPIRTDEELTGAIAVIKSLLSRALDLGEQDYLEVLADIVEKYESDEHPMRSVSDAEMLRHLIDARDITQVKLAEETGIGGSVISEVLHGKRTLTRRQVATLARYFEVNPAIFGYPG